MIFLSSLYFLCMVTFDGQHSIRFVTERREVCNVLGARFVYIQEYDRKKVFDMGRLGNICANQCQHIK